MFGSRGTAFLTSLLQWHQPNDKNNQIRQSVHCNLEMMIAYIVAIQKKDIQNIVLNDLLIYAFHNTEAWGYLKIKRKTPL